MRRKFLPIDKQGLTIFCLPSRVPGYCEVASARQKRRRDQDGRAEHISSGCRAEWRSKGTRVLRGVTLEKTSYAHMSARRTSHS